MTDLELTEYFIDKFKAIPEEKWTTGIMDRENQRCAMGHCSPNHTITGSLANRYSDTEMHKLASLFLTCLQNHAENVNAGLDRRYLQGDPKSRILAALQDIRAIEQYRHMGIQAPKATDNEVQSASSKIKARFAKVFKSLAKW